MKRTVDSTQSFERATDEAPKYVLRLYVAGATPRSSKAIKTLRALCEERLHGRYELEVIDVYQDVARARKDQVTAVPALIKQLPLPLRRLIGDLTDVELVLRGLDLKPLPRTHAKATRRRSGKR